MQVTDLFLLLTRIAENHANGTDIVARIEANDDTMLRIKACLAAGPAPTTVSAPYKGLLGIPLVVVDNMAECEWRVVRDVRVQRATADDMRRYEEHIHYLKAELTAWGMSIGLDVEPSHTAEWHDEVLSNLVADYTRWEDPRDTMNGETDMPAKAVRVPVVHEASDKREGMTFAELKAFVADCERFNVPDGDTVKMVATWRQSIKEITAQGFQP